MRGWSAGVALILLGAGGCAFDSSSRGAVRDGGPGAIDASDTDGDGAPLDAEPGDPCSTWVHATPFHPCSIAEADRELALVLDGGGTYTFDTESGVLTGPDDLPVDDQPFSELINGDAIRLVSVRSIDLSGDSILRVVGDPPLLLASWGNIVIDGEVDLSSGRGLGLGAGGRAVPCDTDQNGAGAVAGGAGGAGGSFGDLGGVGGDGDVAGPPPTAAVTGDPGLRGGCGGGNGGAGTAGEALGGPSGGAVALSALLTITIGGTLHAGGGGGGGGTDLGGGGAGGSGGLIWLDAVEGTELMAGAVLTANGGGGGEGSSADEAGSLGDPAPTDGTRAAAGKGGGPNDGGDGGAGSGADVTTGEDGKDGNATGGGGGGGGAGIIRVDGDLEPGAAVISPPATTS